MDRVKNSDVFVDRYQYRDAKKRKKYRRLCKDGKVKLIWQNKRGWFYRVNRQESGDD